MSEPAIIIIDKSTNLTRAMVEALVETEGLIGVDFAKIEDRMLCEPDLDRIVEQMKFPSVPKIFRNERHHPTSPKQRGGR